MSRFSTACSPATRTRACCSTRLLAPTREELETIVALVQRRATAWLRRRGYLDDRPLDERSNEPPMQTALDACAAIAMGRGQVATLPNAEAPDEADHESAPDKPAVAVERDGFNLHAGVRIEAGDDLGRERLARYGARPPLSLERLRRLPGGRVAYRLKYVSRGRGKHRVMSGMEFMARLAAIIAPPRYPLRPLRGGARAAQRVAQGHRAQAARAPTHVRRRSLRKRPTRQARRWRPKKSDGFPAASRAVEGRCPPPALGRRRRGHAARARRARHRRPPRRRHRARAEHALRAPLGSAAGRRALRRHAEGGLGERCCEVARRGRSRSARSAKAGFACSRSSPSASRCDASSRTSVCRPTRPPLARARDPTDDLEDVEPSGQLGLGLA